ncbi:MAG: 3-ketoacyl-ACP reductase [Phycisphaeraceae bacterium]|nr:3-ketoacyl-ACP reductase [Phycisphaeraceae bacterium]
MPTRKPTAIVTGASRGIGRAIAVGLGTAGYRVAINYNSNADAARECAELVKKSGGEAIVIQADIAKPDDHRRLVETTVEKFGDIDLLVNNAGIAPKVRADLLEMHDTKSFDELIHTNLRGPYLLTVLVANRMVAQVKKAVSAETPKPKIVNITSISAYTASVNRGDYCISKAGLAMMTQLFAARLAEFGINVYEIRPGVIATDMTGPVKAKYDKLILEDSPGLLPIRRWGQPDDVARAVVAIAQNYLPYSTGEVINVDGGFHLRLL